MIYNGIVTGLSSCGVKRLREWKTGYGWPYLVNRLPSIQRLVLPVWAVSRRQNQEVGRESSLVTLLCWSPHTPSRLHVLWQPQCLHFNSSSSLSIPSPGSSPMSPHPTPLWCTCFLFNIYLFNLFNIYLFICLCGQHVTLPESLGTFWQGSQRHDTWWSHRQKCWW